ncbi:hypothetical protein KIN20_008440 [Parelaphostrongylus tenuis]|uniref:Uncharacterized protein n=1 Tax=Parelaphostrongylus tenuis TaxID=148309 RepID=A0AAD5M4W0_PARTN|nr:hypothetical protein KIN20_008440 [Parelaphostrongylus tenuis]
MVLMVRLLDYVRLTSVVTDRRQSRVVGVTMQLPSSVRTMFIENQYSNDLKIWKSGRDRLLANTANDPSAPSPNRRFLDRRWLSLAYETKMRAITLNLSEMGKQGQRSFKPPTQIRNDRKRYQFAFHLKHQPMN